MSLHGVNQITDDAIFKPAPIIHRSIENRDFLFCSPTGDFLNRLFCNPTWGIFYFVVLWVDLFLVVLLGEGVAFLIGDFIF